MAKRQVNPREKIEELRRQLEAEEAAYQQKIGEFKERIEREAFEQFGDSLENVLGHRPVSLKGTKVSPKYRDKDGNEWSGRGVPPKVWSFLYENGKPLPPDRVKQALIKKGYTVD